MVLWKLPLLLNVFLRSSTHHCLVDRVHPILLFVFGACKKLHSLLQATHAKRTFLRRCVRSSNVVNIGGDLHALQTDGGSASVQLVGQPNCVLYARTTN